MKLPGGGLSAAGVVLACLLAASACSAPAAPGGADVRQIRSVPVVTSTVIAVQPDKPLPARVLLSVPALSQLPLLANGCEVTSLAMLLAAAHQHVAPLELARRQPTDAHPPVFKPADGQFSHIVHWGDPNDGFVGQVSGYGYGIYHGPLARLLAQALPGRALDLTDKPVERILAQVASGTPVILWVTSTLKPTDSWTTWAGPHGPVRATIFEHAALLVGYDAEHLYINNPLTGSRLQPVPRAPLLAAWRQLGQQALSYSSPTPTRAVRAGRAFAGEIASPSP